MKLTDEQIKFLEEHNIELVLKEMKVRDHGYRNWVRRHILFKRNDGYYLDIQGAKWAKGEEIPKFELTREKVLEWANHEDQQDTFVTMEFFAWRIAKEFDYTYDEHYNKFHVRQNGENRPLTQVVEDWYRGREL